eukprot:scaffold101796_cov28-Tisochrysis_lutea.AAC.7
MAVKIEDRLLCPLNERLNGVETARGARTFERVGCGACAAERAETGRREGKRKSPEYWHWGRLMQRPRPDYPSKRARASGQQRETC